MAVILACALLVASAHARARVRMLAGGQPGGRVGCCFKSASYLDSIVAAPAAPAEREGAVARFRESLTTRTLADALTFASEHAQYTPRPFRVGDVLAAAGERPTAAIVLSLGKLIRLSRAEAEQLHAAAGGCAQAEDRAALDMFALTGWEGVHFPEGLALEWR
ncbi:hypothetical protein KFE25_001116 [Diacronema lutheri]|uniref:Uncharacterized protein n=1 Tax=Diacronema lutheri TaxID=2081491 RepID=A0A8J6C495_DIALT|nr:hypothetical protein KFE25_001116 [Diacronema lutheri]